MNLNCKFIKFLFFHDSMSNTIVRNIDNAFK